MKKVLRILLTGVVVSICSIASARSVFWQPSLSAGLEKAKSSGKLAMAYFYVEWSKACTMMTKNFEDPKVQNVCAKLIPMRFDAEKEGKAVAAKYGVRSFPKLLFLRPDGTVVTSIDRNTRSDLLANRLEFLLTSINQLDSAQKRLQANPADAGAIEEMALYYAKMGRVAKSIEFVEKAIRLDPRNEKKGIARAYNALGDLYQNNNIFDPAVDYFKKAIPYGNNPRDLVYSYVSIGSCYLQSNRPNLSRPWFQKIIDLPTATDGEKNSARNLMPRNGPGGNRRPGSR